MVFDAMKRRDFLEKLKNAALSIFCGCFFTGCKLMERRTYCAGQFAYYLGYLIYGNNPPTEEVARIEGYMQSAAQKYAGLQSKYERIYFDILLKTWPASFQNLSCEKQKIVFKKIMPTLLLHQEIADLLYAYLEECVVKMIYYPDVPGRYGECGWLVLEGEVWDRYYPPKGS
jgi:hypothetical protein